MTTNAAFRRVLLVGLFTFACAGLCSLGLWQLSRAEAKRLRYESFAERREQPAVDIDTIGDEAPTADYHWRAVQMRGHYGGSHILLDNRVRNAQAGYEVLTPFRTDGGRIVLVNRGWVAMPASREAAPDVVAPPTRLSFAVISGRRRWSVSIWAVSALNRNGWRHDWYAFSASTSLRSRP